MITAHTRLFISHQTTTISWSPASGDRGYEVIDHGA